MAAPTLRDRLADLSEYPYAMYIPISSIFGGVEWMREDEVNESFDSPSRLVNIRRRYEYISQFKGGSHVEAVTLASLVFGVRFGSPLRSADESDRIVCLR